MAALVGRPTGHLGCGRGGRPPSLGVRCTENRHRKGGWCRRWRTIGELMIRNPCLGQSDDRRAPGTMRCTGTRHRATHPKEIESRRRAAGHHAHTFVGPCSPSGTRPLDRPLNGRIEVSAEAIETRLRHDRQPHDGELAIDLSAPDPTLRSNSRVEDSACAKVRCGARRWSGPASVPNGSRQNPRG